MAKDETVASDNVVVHELALANQENRKLKAQNKAYKGQVVMLQNKVGSSKLQSTPSEPESSPENPSKESTEPHYVGSWQKVCPHCNIPNPEFKDETTCKGCGSHLGEAILAKGFKACPNCGGPDVEQFAGAHV